MLATRLGLFGICFRWWFALSSGKRLAIMKAHKDVGSLKAGELTMIVYYPSDDNQTLFFTHEKFYNVGIPVQFTSRSVAWFDENFDVLLNVDSLKEYAKYVKYQDMVSVADNGKFHISAWDEKNYALLSRSAAGQVVAENYKSLMS